MSTKDRAAEACETLQRAVPAFAGCSRCVKWANKPDRGRFAALLIGLASLVTAFAMFLIGRRHDVAAGDVWVFAAFLGALGLFWIIEYRNSIFGQPHYGFRMNGKIHVHAKDPRIEMLLHGEYRWTLNKPKDDPAHIIVGPIVRLRNGGYIFQKLYSLFRGKPYNSAWMPHPKTDPLVSIAFGSSIWRCTLHDQYQTFAGRMRHSFSLDDALTVLSQGGIGATVRGWRNGTGMFHVLADGVQETMEFLTATRDRRQGSPVGRGARERLEQAVLRLERYGFEWMPLEEFGKRYGADVRGRIRALSTLASPERSEEGTSAATS